METQKSVASESAAPISSVNLAVALGAMGAKVGLLDADIYGPSIPVMMGVRGAPQSNGEKIEPLEGYGIKVMSLGFLMPENSPVIWRGPMVAGAIQQFLREVKRKKAQEELETNIFLAPHARNDSITLLNPSVGIEIPFRKNRISLDYDAQMFLYGKFNAENHLYQHV